MILDIQQHWTCPNCPAEARTVGRSNRFHNCAGLAGLTAPLVLAGTDCRVYAVERESYVGGEQVQYDAHGRPVQAVVTERPDGSNDVVVLAPVARWSAQGVM